MAENMQEIEFLSKKILDLNKQLIESEKAKSKFLSLVANELNNPMSSILGLVGHLEPQSEAKKTAILELLQEEASKLDFHVQNLVAAAELESGELENSYALVLVSDIVDDVKKALKYRLRGKNISIELNGQSEIVSDASKLFLVLKNIVANAIDYGESDSAIVVEHKIESDESTTISITNIGKPPAVEYKPQVFTRFAHDASGAHGLGIGLSIAKGLCERLDGTIDYNSDERSVSFVITLPKLSNALISANACGANEFLFEKFDDAFEL
jgi:signal transduction histidine kinase